MSNKNENLIKEILMEKELNDSTTGKGQGLRFNKGKLRYDLVNTKAHEDFVQVLTDGAIKYAARNWERGLSWTSVIASLKRHLAAIENGEDFDKESGRLHIAHAACNVHFLNAFYYIFPQGDDRPKRVLSLPKIGLDIDGVLADFSHSWTDVYPEVNPSPSSWYFDRKIKARFDEMKNSKVLDDFYLKIKPIIKPEDIPFDPHCYITSRPVSKEITEQWLDMHGFPAKPVFSTDIFCSKLDAAKKSGIEIFIDDSFENFAELNNNGIFTYLYTTPWNTKYEVGHMRIESLKNIPILKQ